MLAVKLRLCPEQTGELLPATGAAGVWLMVTATVTVASGGHPGTDAVMEYVPVALVETPGMVGSSAVDVKLLGPLQLYIALTTVLAVKLKVCPEQTGVLLPAIGAEGGGLIVTETVPEGPVQPFSVVVTE